MDTGQQQPTPSMRSLTYAWLGLVALSIVGLGLGQWFHDAPWLQLVVAAIVWLKGALVAHRFIETKLAHPFIRRVLSAFIAFTPLALILISFFGPQVARWATL